MTDVFYLRFGINGGMRIGNHKNIGKTAGSGSLGTRLKVSLCSCPGSAKFANTSTQPGDTCRSLPLMMVSAFVLIAG